MWGADRRRWGRCCGGGCVCGAWWVWGGGCWWWMGKLVLKGARDAPGIWERSPDANPNPAEFDTKVRYVGPMRRAVLGFSPLSRLALSFLSAPLPYR